VDKENNLFVTLNEGSAFGLLKINEEENSVVTLALGANGNVLNPQPPCADMTTGIITSTDDNVVAQYYTCDPQEGWAMRRRLWKWKEGSVDLPSHTWKKAVAACEVDGCLYMHQRDGQLVKVNPITRVAEIIFKVSQEGDSYGLAFHPHRPNMLYFSFSTSGGVNANTICSMDINDPEGTFTHLNNSTTPGHRDGELATAQFNNPFQIYFDPDGYLYIADCNNHCIRRITPENIVETVLGIPGTAGWQDGGKEEALFNQPTGLGVNAEGSIYVAEWGNNRIRKLAVE
jgi:streptogramin lyase